MPLAHASLKKKCRLKREGALQVTEIEFHFARFQRDIERERLNIDRYSEN